LSLHIFDNLAFKKTEIVALLSVVQYIEIRSGGVTLLVEAPG